MGHLDLKSIVRFPPSLPVLLFFFSYVSFSELMQVIIGNFDFSGGLLLGRTLSVLVTITLGTSMAARQGPLAMAAHQICLQVWLAVSLLTDALAVSAQVGGDLPSLDHVHVHLF